MDDFPVYSVWTSRYAVVPIVSALEIRVSLRGGPHPFSYGLFLSFFLQQRVTKIPGSPDPNIPEWDWGDDSTSSTSTTATSTAATKGKDAVEGKVSVCGWIVMTMFPLWQIFRVQFKRWCRNTQVSGVCVAVSVSAQE